MSFVFPTNASQVQAFAGALYGIQVGSTTMAQVNADIAANGGLAATLNGYYASSFGGVANATVANTVATNLGLTGAALTSGAAYITAQLNAAAPGARGAVISSIVNLFSNLASDATFGAAATAWNAKVAIAAAYTGAANVAVGTEVVMNGAFTLTAGIDNIAGTSGNDTFTGNYQVGTTTTIQAGDSLNGGNGTDTLFISAQSTATTAQSLSGVTLNSVEIVTVANSSAQDLTVASNNFTGTTQVGNNGSSGNVIFTGTKGVSAAQMGGDAGNLTVTASALSLSGDADSFTLNVNGVAGNATATTGVFTVGDSTAGIAETLTIRSTGNASTVALADANDTRNLVLSGDAALSITSTLDTTVKSVDASGMTAGVTLILPTSDISIVGGAGNDVIRAAGTLTSADTIDAGAGTDALRLTSALTASNARNLKNFETLSADSLSVASTATTAGFTLTQDASVLSGISTLEVRGVANANAVTSATSATTTLYGGVSFTNAAGTETLNIGSGTFNVSGAVTNTATTASQAVASVLNATVAASLRTNTTADAITVNLGSASGSTLGIESNTATLTNSTQTGSSVSADSVITLSLDDYETITVNTRAGASKLDTLSSTSLKTLAITGNKDLTISATTAANLATVDASKLTGDLNLTSSSSTRAQNITAGAGNDTILVDTTGRNDTIDGGAGNDTIGKSGGSATGNDNMSGGSGNDTIHSGAGNDVIDGGADDDSIVGAAGNDNISGGAGNDTFAMAWDATATSAATGLAFNTNDSINGGDGTDSIQLTGTATTAQTIDLSGSTLTNFSNVTNIERLQFNVANTAASTIKVGDVLLGSFNNALTVTVGTTAATNTNGLSVDASAVLNTNSSVTYTGTTAVGTSMTIGNGIDRYTGGAASDTVNVTNVLFLQPTDVISGGLGSDTLSFNTNATLVLTADKFAGVTGFETFTVDNATTETAAARFTLTDALAVANAASATNTFTVSRAAAEAGTLNVDGSAVTSVNLALSGAAGADTLTGGALNDTITGGAGADSMTGGAGNDMFAYTAAGSASGDVVAGGDGTDTIRINGSALTGTSNLSVDLTFATISGVEAIRFDRVDGASTATGTVGATFAATQISGATYSVAAVAGSTATSPGAAQLTVSSSTASSLNFSGLTPANTSSDDAAELVLIYANTGTAAQYITGSGLSDSITGGAGADTIIAGDGSDTITDSAGADVYYLSDSTTATSTADVIVAVADTGTAFDVVATAAINSTTSVVVSTGTTAINFNNVATAIVYGMSTGDSVTSGLAALTNGTAKSSSTIVTADKVNTVRGTFDSSSGAFTYSATGLDTLVVYDSDATATTAAYEAVILVGVSSVTLGASTAAMSVAFA